MGDVRSRAGVPTTNDFNSPLGMPIVVNQTTGDAYVMLSDSTVSGLNTTGNAATATTAFTVSTTVASGATGTTQSVGDNSTKIATTAFVQNALPSRKNLIINGAFDIAQRNTTYALTTSLAYGCVDRWAFMQATTAACTASQVAVNESDVPCSFALKLQRMAAATTTGQITARSAFETVDSVKYKGKQVTLSFWAVAGANFSASGGILNAMIRTGTGTDQSCASMSTWTGATTPVTVAQAITATRTRYTVTGTIPATATQIGIEFNWTPVGTAGADDSVQITMVQVEVGASVTDFDFRSFAQELALCQRYLPCWVLTGTVSPWAPAYTSTATIAYAVVTFPVQARATITGIVVSSAIGNLNFTQGTANYPVTALAIIGTSFYGALVTVTCGGGGMAAPGVAGSIYSPTSAVTVYFTGCEL